MMGRLKILCSAYDCNPYIGSDSYIGWSYAVNMQKLNDVTVVTSEWNKTDIEKYLAENPQSVAHEIQFVFVKRNEKIKTLIGKFNEQIGVLVTYYLWQYPAYRCAKKIQKYNHFDIVHHVSIADFRCLGFMINLKIPMVVGPIGGGQEIPDGLCEYVDKSRKIEKFRSLTNRICFYAPGYLKTIKKSKVIFVSNEETKTAIEFRLGMKYSEKIKQLCELCVSESELEERRANRGNNQIVRILAAGRLLPRKGIELLVDAVNLIDSKTKFQVLIYGTGPEQSAIEKKISELHLEKKVFMKGSVPHDKMKEIYEETDVFVLPSLRETTGTSLIEAMRFEIPVVALNQGGARNLVRNDMGILVDIGSRETTVFNLAKAIQKLVEDAELRVRMGEMCKRRLSKEYTWEKRVQSMNKMYHEIISEVLVDEASYK